MSKQFTTCPQCGAMGEIGANCEFCGAHIEAKDNSTVCNELIPQHRTISSAEFAKKVSIFHNVGNFIEGLAVARIGQLNGVINLNGDLVLPLEYNEIKIDTDWGKRYLLIDAIKYLGRWECHLVFLNDRRMISIPSGSHYLVDSSNYSFMPDYDNSILRYNGWDRTEYDYCNFVTNTVIYFTFLFESDHQCYVSPRHAKLNSERNKELLTEPGIYDIKTWSLVKKLCIEDTILKSSKELEDKILKRIYNSDKESVDKFLSRYDELIAEQERIAQVHAEFEEWKENRRKSELPSPLSFYMLFGILFVLIVSYFMWLGLS
ncbi:MAG: hypothetical protein MJY92_01885 [Bacteroidales bacterium]|nr:hypothetical protein [Bacteroidales bacterium]